MPIYPIILALKQMITDLHQWLSMPRTQEIPKEYDLETFWLPISSDRRAYYEDTSSLGGSDKETKGGTSSIR